MTRYFNSMAVLLAIMFLQGCVSNSASGGYTLNAYDEQYDSDVGDALYETGIQQSGGRYRNSAELSDYVSRVANRVASASGISGHRFEVAVIDDLTPNAWALPGGKLAVNTGMILLLENESELAAVIGHEMGHVTARHGSRGQTKAALAGIGAMLVEAIAGEAAGAVADLSTGFINAGFSRSHEIEADRIGGEYMVMAGYSPHGSVTLQERLARIGGSASMLQGLLSSHPQSEDRAERNLRFAKSVNGGFVGKEEYLAATAVLRGDIDGYDYYLKSQKSASNKNYRQAYSEIKSALKILPLDGKVWEHKGDIETLLGHSGMAGHSYQKAASVNPGYYSHHLALGFHQVRYGNKGKAFTHFAKADQLLPTAPASYHLGAISIERQQYSVARAHLNKAVALGGPYAKKAQALIIQTGL